MIKKADVHKAAKLAKLRLSDEEADLYTEQLKNILKYVEKLDEAKTENIQATSHAVDNIEAPFRVDEVKQNQVIEKILAQAPKRDEHFFSVPKVL